MNFLLYIYSKYQNTSGWTRQVLIKIYHIWVAIRSAYTKVLFWFESKQLKIRDNKTDSAIFNSVFGANELKIFAPISKDFDPEYIVDIGAYAGYTSVWYARKYPKAKIIAVEPESSNYAVLEENIKPYKNVHSIKKAVWPQKTSVFVRDMGTGDWGFKMESNETDSIETVQTVTIEELLAQSPENKIDILKIDIEGAEIEVLANSENWHNKVNVIMIELHEWFAPGCIEAYEKFKIQGGSDG